MKIRINFKPGCGKHKDIGCVAYFETEGALLHVVMDDDPTFDAFDFPLETVEEVITLKR